MSSLFNSDYEFNGKITNADVLIKAFAEMFVMVLKGTREAIAEGRPCIIKDGCIGPLEEASDAQAEETVTIPRKDWDGIVALARSLKAGGLDLFGSIEGTDQNLKK